MNRYISISLPLIKNSKNFLKIEHTTLLKSFKYLFKSVIFVGWGRKKSGIWAVIMAKLSRNRFLLLEDGFIRSIGLGVEGAKSFSIVKDDIGIYYDATAPSRLENILNSYDFKSDRDLMSLAKRAIEKIVEYKISKYNSFKEIDLSVLDTQEDKILIIAQTNNDSSLRYGLAGRFTTKQMIDDAIRDNPYSKIYIKIHPDVICGKKESDIDIKDIPNSCIVLSDNINPIELLGYFSKIYTKTSGMGMEALLLNKEVYCYGMPFYAGWGVTIDRLKIERRKRKLSIDEIFAGAYILYSSYYIDKEVDIIELIEYIYDRQKK